MCGCRIRADIRIVPTLLEKKKAEKCVQGQKLNIYYLVSLLIYFGISYIRSLHHRAPLRKSGEISPFSRRKSSKIFPVHRILNNQNTRFFFPSSCSFYSGQKQATKNWLTKAEQKSKPYHIDHFYYTSKRAHKSFIQDKNETRHQSPSFCHKYHAYECQCTVYLHKNRLSNMRYPNESSRLSSCC